MNFHGCNPYEEGERMSAVSSVAQSSGRSFSPRIEFFGRVAPIKLRQKLFTVNRVHGHAWPEDCLDRGTFPFGNVRALHEFSTRSTMAVNDEALMTNGQGYAKSK